jgi:hypothetical protein
VGIAQPLETTSDPVIDAVRVEIEAHGPPAKTITHPDPAPLDRRLVDIMEHDLVSGLERELGDPGAHRPGSNHAHDLALGGAGLAGHDQIDLKCSNGWQQAVQW